MICFMLCIALATPSRSTPGRCSPLRFPGRFVSARDYLIKGGQFGKPHLIVQHLDVRFTIDFPSIFPIID